MKLIHLKTSVSYTTFISLKEYIILLLLILACSVSAQKHELSINYYDGCKVINKNNFAFISKQVKDSKGKIWNISIDSTILDKSKSKIDYHIQFLLISDNAEQVSVEANFKFNNWSPNNFVFIPACVYAGNKFEKKVMKYPPYWYDKKEWKIQMPTTTPLLPSLEKHGNNGKIEINTGNASSPLMAFYSPKNHRCWMLQTVQGNKYGNYGLIAEEKKKEEQAMFALTSPSVKEKNSNISDFVGSEDRGANLKKGDIIELRFRIYSFPSSSLQDMYAFFMKNRKALNANSSDYAVIPYSELWKVMDDMFQKNRWDESINMYSLSKPNPKNTWNQIWQLGWVGGGQVTLPFLLNGKSLEKERAYQNLNVIFERTQAPSGFFYAYGNGIKFYGFGFNEPFKNNETFVRSQGDFLYMAQKQFGILKSTGEKIPKSWMIALHKQADAFVRLWNRYHQVGQFINVETGDICIGGSTAGAIVPGGLALAYETFGNRIYLNVADSLAEKFYSDYVLKGYTAGGPAEILSSPDSESAFGLFESYITLYEVTKNKKWLHYAKDLLPICASWVVSYDYKFPNYSELYKLKVHSTGAVWASIANKHGAPAICTWSGESLLKYFRYTGDKSSIELLKDIAHGIPQYISTKDRPIAKLEPGGCCERVNLSDWEGKANIGGNVFGSCSWVESASLLTITQLPSIYVQKDKAFVETFDNLNAKILHNNANSITLQIENPTRYDAEAKIYVETSKEAQNERYNIMNFSRIKKCIIKAKNKVILNL